MEKYDLCECEGTGFVAVADKGGDGIDYVECPKHHASYTPSIEGLLVSVSHRTGITSEFFKS